jgi:mono/diheme cytochrome c family protein
MDIDHMYSSADPARSFTSNGERIYFTGRDKSGRLVANQGGNMHAQMHDSACVSCHGVQLEGGRRMYPSFWLTTPPLTAEALFGAHDDGHGNHGVYTRDSLKTAIMQGVDPSGKTLDSAMPRWLLSESDLDDLVGYLADGALESVQESHEH